MGNDQSVVPHFYNIIDPVGFSSSTQIFTVDIGMRGKEDIFEDFGAETGDQSKSGLIMNDYSRALSPTCFCLQGILEEQAASFVILRQEIARATHVEVTIGQRPQFATSSRGSTHIRERSFRKKRKYW